MEFKKLSAVEAVETVSETAYVLIEEDGVVKRAPKDEVGGIKVASAEVGQTIVVKAVDDNGVPTEWECMDIGGQIKSVQNSVGILVDEMQDLVTAQSKAVTFTRFYDTYIRPTNDSSKLSVNEERHFPNPDYTETLFRNCKLGDLVEVQVVVPGTQTASVAILRVEQNNANGTFWAAVYNSDAEKYEYHLFYVNICYSNPSISKLHRYM